jgi:ABC-2 type transport system ATP-binding protein
VVALRTLLSDLRRRASIVFSTHLLAEAQTVCDRVVVIDHGRVVLDRPAGVAAGAGVRLRVVVGGAEPAAVRSALLAVPGVRAVRDDVCTVDGPAVAEDIAADVCARGWRLRQLAFVPDDLEAAFLSAVTGAAGAP